MTLDPQRWREIEAVFQDALERPEAERDGFVLAACEGDDELRAEVESLLRFDEPGRELLDKGPGSIVPSRALAAGAQLGAYEILDLLGAGAWARSTGRETRASNATWR